MSSEYPEYEQHLERKSVQKSSVDMGAEHGVSESSSDMTHRSEMDKPNTVSFEERKSVSQRVNERREGEIVSHEKKDHGACGGDASNENDDAQVDEGKSVKQKYADRYGNNDE